MKWNEVFTNWIDYDVIWNFVDEIIQYGSTGEESLLKFQQLEDYKKKKIITLILWLKGNKIVQEKQIHNYKVTVNDIEMIKESRKTISINVSNIEVS